MPVVMLRLPDDLFNGSQNPAVPQNPFHCLAVPLFQRLRRVFVLAQLLRVFLLQRLVFNNRIHLPPAKTVLDTVFSRIFFQKKT